MIDTCVSRFFETITYLKALTYEIESPPHLFLIDLPFILRKLDTNTINTVPLIRRCRISFSLEHVPQMPTAIRADDLRPRHTKRVILMPRHSARQGVEIRGPSAAGREFVGGLVKRRTAASALVDAAGRGVFVVFACSGRLGAFLAEDAELL